MFGVARWSSRELATLIRWRSPVRPRPALLKEMRLVLDIPRNPNRRLWEEHMMVDALVSGTPTHYVCASEQLAKQTFESAIALLNGRDPKATPG